jgi:hypothetical protein
MISKTFSTNPFSTSPNLCTTILTILHSSPSISFCQVSQYFCFFITSCAPMLSGAFLCRKTDYLHCGFFFNYVSAVFFSQNGKPRMFFLLGLSILPLQDLIQILFSPSITFPPVQKVLVNFIESFLNVFDQVFKLNLLSMQIMSLNRRSGLFFISRRPISNLIGIPKMMKPAITTFAEYGFRV